MRGLIKASVAIKLCLDSFFFFLVNWGQKLGMKD